MASYTTNLNLKKPGGTDYVQVADFNTNADALDAAIGDLSALETAVKTDVVAAINSALTDADATVAIGTTTVGNPGTPPSVSNSGTNKDAVFNFTIPREVQHHSGAAITGTSTTPTAYDTGVTLVAAGDTYRNTDAESGSYQNEYVCTLGGNAATALWMYVSNVRGAPGGDSRVRYISPEQDGISTNNTSRMWLAPFSVTETTNVQYVRLDFLNYSATALYEVAIYDEQLNVITRSGVKSVTAMRVYASVDYAALAPGKYYFAFSCNEATIKFPSFSGANSLYAAYALPLPATITALYEAGSSPCFAIYAYDLDVPTGFTATVDSTRRYFCKSAQTGILYGWNLTTGKVFSRNGSTFTDLMTMPPNGFWEMVVDDTNSKFYVINGNGQIYKSSGITSSDTWTDITDTTYKRSNAINLPFDGICIFGGYLWYGEYTRTYDAANPDHTGEMSGGPKIIRYNLTTGVWELSAQFANARHVHSFIPNGATSLFVSLGDSGYSDIGYYRLLPAGIVSGGPDTWVKWTSSTTPHTSLYSVDATVVSDSDETYLLGAADQPYAVLTKTKIFNVTAGQGNVSAAARRPQYAQPTDTARSVVLDSAKNAYFYITTEGHDSVDFCVSPPPYTQVYRLYHFPSGASLTAKMITGSTIYMNSYAFHTVTFKARPQASKRQYLYNDGIVYTALTSSFTLANDTSGTYYAAKNADNMFVMCMGASGVYQRAGYFSSDKVDTTGYKYLVMEGYIEGSYGDVSGTPSVIARVGINSSTPSFSGAAAVGSLPNPSQYARQAIVVTLDLTSYQGLYYMGGYVHALADAVEKTMKLTIKKLYLSKI